VRKCGEHFLTSFQKTLDYRRAADNRLSELPMRAGRQPFRAPSNSRMLTVAIDLGLQL